MKRLAIAAAGAAVFALSACTSSTPSAAPAHHAGAVTVPISCNRQYRDWTHAEGKGVMHALAAVTHDAAGKRARRHLIHDLTQVRRAVATASRHPIPACADPRGYWDVLLMHVNAAVSAGGSPADARAAMQDVAYLHRRLLSEIARTAQ